MIVLPVEASPQLPEMPDRQLYIDSPDLDWVEDETLWEWCSRIVQRFTFFEHIQMTNVLVLRTYQKQSGSRSKIATCSAIRYPARALHPQRKYLYIITVFDELFEDLSEKAQLLVLYHELYHIPKDFNGQFVRHHSVEDFVTMVDAFGTGWTAAPEEGLPHLLQDEHLQDLYGYYFELRKDQA